MEKQALHDLPEDVRGLALHMLAIFAESGPRGLAERGLFSAEEVSVAEERCADFGERFRVPPLSAPVHVHKGTDSYELDLPLWLEGEDEPSDLFIFLDVDPVTNTARMTDIYVP